MVNISSLNNPLDHQHFLCVRFDNSIWQIDEIANEIGAKTTKSRAQMAKNSDISVADYQK